LTRVFRKRRDYRVRVVFLRLLSQTSYFKQKPQINDLPRRRRGESRSKWENFEKNRLKRLGALDFSRKIRQNKNIISGDAAFSRSAVVVSPFFYCSALI